MDKQLTQYLLSEQNIQDLIDKIDCTVYIKAESLQACRQVIKTNLSNYLNRLASIPQTERQLISTIAFLNKKCYDEIVEFIASKYQGKSIFKQHEETILTREEVEKLLQQRVSHDTILRTLTDPSILLYLKSLMDTYNESVKEEGEIIDIHQLQDLLRGNKPEAPKPDINSQILSIKTRIEDLATMPQNEQVMQEKASLINSLVKFQKETMDTSTEMIDNKYQIDVKITPRSADDLRSIVFKTNVERKVKSIQLHKYLIPKNSHNVTTFTNNLTVYYNGDVIKHDLVPGYYTIEQIINSIQAVMAFLKITIDNKIVTFSSNSKFDLLVHDNSILPLLGFADSNSMNRLSHTAESPYNLDLNDSVFITLDRSTIDPIELSLAKETKLETPIILRQPSKSMAVKDITVKLLDKLNHFYDLIGKTIHLHISVEYEDHSHA